MSLDRGGVLLQALLARLRPWLPRIGAHADSVDVEAGESGEFSVVARWRDPSGAERELRRAFTRAHCFGRTYALPPEAWSVELRACDHARAFLRDLLKERGLS